MGTFFISRSNRTKINEIVNIISYISIKSYASRIGLESFFISYSLLKLSMEILKEKTQTRLKYHSSKEEYCLKENYFLEMRSTFCL